VTDPVGLPPSGLPVIVALSVSDSPRTIVALAGEEDVPLVAVVTKKHSSELVSLELL
jgi:hypothetical protein